jgi:hypothetical protein
MGGGGKEIGNSDALQHEREERKANYFRMMKIYVHRYSGRRRIFLQKCKRRRAEGAGASRSGVEAFADLIEIVDR